MSNMRSCHRWAHSSKGEDPGESCQWLVQLWVVSAAARSCATSRKDKYTEKGVTDRVASHLGLTAGPEAWFSK